MTAGVISCGRDILVRLKRCTETIRLPEERSNCSMANSLFSAPTCSLKAPARPGSFNFSSLSNLCLWSWFTYLWTASATFLPLSLGIIVGKPVAGRVLRINDVSRNTKNARFQSLQVKVSILSSSHFLSSVLARPSALPALSALYFLL